MYLLQVGGIEQPVGPTLDDIRRAAAKGEKKGGAMILHVDRLTALNDSYMRAAVDLAPRLEVFAPVRHVDEHSPQLGVMIEGQLHPRRPVLGVPKRNDIAIRVGGIPGSALHHGEAP